ncbi:MAG: MBL fold metallo-hydrolase [Bacteroidales bacterium]
MRRFLLLLLIGTAYAVFNVTGQQTKPWFTSKEVSDKVYQIDDNGAVNIFLVVGTDSALVIDTGMGTADLSSFIKTLTTKPLIIINTHGHPDHAGANYQFPKVYVHPSDSAASRSFNTPAARKGAAGTMQAGKSPSASELYKGVEYKTRLIPVKEGRVFDIGGRKLEVLSTPGHTAGSISLLDRGNRLLFTGDNNNTLVWLFLQGCSPLSQYQKTLEKQVKMLSLFSTILPGHGPAMSSDFVKDQLECVKGIISGKLEAKPYKSFAGDAMVSTFGKASVAFNPKNL